MTPIPLHESILILYRHTLLYAILLTSERPLNTTLIMFTLFAYVSVISMPRVNPSSNAVDCSRSFDLSP